MLKAIDTSISNVLPLTFWGSCNYKNQLYFNEHNISTFENMIISSNYCFKISLMKYNPYYDFFKIEYDELISTYELEMLNSFNHNKGIENTNFQNLFIDIFKNYFNILNSALSVYHIILQFSKNIIEFPVNSITDIVIAMPQFIDIIKHEYFLHKDAIISLFKDEHFNFEYEKFMQNYNLYTNAYNYDDDIYDINVIDKNLNYNEDKFNQEIVKYKEEENIYIIINKLYNHSLFLLNSLYNILNFSKLNDKQKILFIMNKLSFICNNIFDIKYSNELFIITNILFNGKVRVETAIGSILDYCIDTITVSGGINLIADLINGKSIKKSLKQLSIDISSYFYPIIGHIYYIYNVINCVLSFFTKQYIKHINIASMNINILVVRIINWVLHKKYQVYIEDKFFDIDIKSKKYSHEEDAINDISKKYEQMFKKNSYICTGIPYELYNSEMMSKLTLYEQYLILILKEYLYEEWLKANNFSENQKEKLRNYNKTISEGVNLFDYIVAIINNLRNGIFKIPTIEKGEVKIEDKSKGKTIIDIINDIINELVKNIKNNGISTLKNPKKKDKEDKSTNNIIKNKNNFWDNHKSENIVIFSINLYIYLRTGKDPYNTLTPQEYYDFICENNNKRNKNKEYKLWIKIEYDCGWTESGYGISVICETPFTVNSLSSSSTPCTPPNTLSIHNDEKKKMKDREGKYLKKNVLKFANIDAFRNNISVGMIIGNVGNSIESMVISSIVYIDYELMSLRYNGIRKHWKDKIKNLKRLYVQNYISTVLHSHLTVNVIVICGDKLNKEFSDVVIPNIGLFSNLVVSKYYNRNMKRKERVYDIMEGIVRINSKKVGTYINNRYNVKSILMNIFTYLKKYKKVNMLLKFLSKYGIIFGSSLTSYFEIVMIMLFFRYIRNIILEKEYITDGNTMIMINYMKYMRIEYMINIMNDEKQSLFYRENIIKKLDSYLDVKNKFVYKDTKFKSRDMRFKYKDTGFKYKNNKFCYKKSIIR